MPAVNDIPRGAEALLLGGGVSIRKDAMQLYRSCVGKGMCEDEGADGGVVALVRRYRGELGTERVDEAVHRLESCRKRLELPLVHA